MKIVNPQKCVVFFDFDNTIATCDVFDSLLPRFSRDDLWVRLERDWEKGKIGSHTCLQGQIKGMSIKKNELDRYLRSVKLDPYFKKIIKALSAKKIKTIILSDNFDYILKRILTHNDIKKVKLYCNKLGFSKNRLIPYFPYRSRKCQVCAHCKTKNLLANVDKGSMIVYIGDGRSDICPSQYADLVFAKDKLLEFFKGKGRACLSYKNLKDVHDYFMKSFKISPA